MESNKVNGRKIQSVQIVIMHFSSLYHAAEYNTPTHIAIPTQICHKHFIFIRKSHLSGCQPELVFETGDRFIHMENKINDFRGYNYFRF